MRPVQFPSAVEGIARERDLLELGRPAILIWQPRTSAIVVPDIWARRVGVQAMGASTGSIGWPIFVRPSGGGAVPQGPTTLNLAVVLPIAPAFRIEHGFSLICGMLVEALTRFEVDAETGPVAGAFCDGAWNVTVKGRKLAGTAQRWRARPGGHVALIHAALQVAPLPSGVWPALEHLHAAVGAGSGPDPQSHTALTDLFPQTMRSEAFAGALARAADDRLKRALTARQQAA